MSQMTDIKPDPGKAPGAASTPVEGSGEESPPGPPQTSGGANQTLRGIGLALLAGLMFTLLDTSAKWIAQDLALEVAVWGRYSFHLLLMLLIFGIRDPMRLIRTQRPVALVLRGALLTVCTVGMFVALKHIPIADAQAIGFVAPLFVVALSIPLLGEVVGVRRWSAVLIGFLGMLVIVRPGFADVHWAYFVVVGVAFLYAIYILTTRRLAQTEDAVAMLFYTAVIGTIATSVVVPFRWETPTVTEWGVMLVMGAIGGGAHLIVIHAYRIASASLLAPFQYVQIVWATALGFVVFGDFPDLWTIAGAAIIVASGLYVCFREAELERRRTGG